MNITDDTGDFILKILGFITGFFTLRWITKIYAGKDRRLNQYELSKLTAYLIFCGAFIYILFKEGNRPSNTEHVFSEIWLAMVITGLLSVLGMERIFETFKSLIELLIRLRTAKVEDKPKDEVKEEL